MTNTVISVYDRFSDAENARNELLGAGFAVEDIHLESLLDEAGTTQGNFTVGNGRGERSNAFPRAKANKNPAYQMNFSVPKSFHPGGFVLTVVAHTAEQLQLASQITRH